MTCTERLELELFADWHQFLVCDDDLNGMGVPDWSDEALARHLDVTARSVTIGTARNLDVPVVVAPVVPLTQNMLATSNGS